MRKEKFKAFEIPIAGLKQGQTNVNFKIDETFFKNFEGSDDFSGCNIHVDLVVDKRRNNLIVLEFYIGGTIHVKCDRCLTELDQELLDEFTVYLKFSGDEYDTDDAEDVIVLPLGETHINVAHLVYEFINLSIPLQKGCPPSEVGGPKCDKKVLAYFEGKSDEEPSDNEENKLADQRWSALLKLKQKDHGTPEAENIEDKKG